MRLLMAMAAGAAALAGGTAQAASIEIRDAVVRVVVMPEARSDIKVEVLNQNGALPLDVRTRGDDVIVDGRLDRRIRNCRGIGGKVWVRVAGVGEVGWADMPQIVVRTPKDVRIEAGGAVFGAIGRAASVDLSNLGCGDWTVANVEGKLKISQAGSGDTRMGSAAQAVLRIAGSGDIDARRVNGPLDVDIAGSGDVSVQSIEGSLGVKVAGSGDVRIGGGKASSMNVTVMGSGDVNFDGVAENLEARIAGSGDVRVKAVTGSINKRVMGSGGVTIG